ncbi:unnamed protein product, partial [marine sediment metagenome]
DEKYIKIKFKKRLEIFKKWAPLTLNEELRLNRFIVFFCKDLKNYHKRYILKDIKIYLTDLKGYVGISLLIRDIDSKKDREIHVYPLNSPKLRIDLDALRKHSDKDTFYCKSKI